MDSSPKQITMASLMPKSYKDYVRLEDVDWSRYPDNSATLRAVMEVTDMPMQRVMQAMRTYWNAVKRDQRETAARRERDDRREELLGMLNEGRSDEVLREIINHLFGD